MLFFGPFDGATAAAATGKNLPGQGKILRPPRGLLIVRLPSIGLVAQLVEQCPFKALVQGSSPCQPTNLPLTFRSRLRAPPATSQMASKDIPLYHQVLDSL